MSNREAAGREQLLALGRQRYIALTTYRRNGEPVTTPVWVARDEERLLVWTGSHTGKVRRIRATARVTLSPATMRGRPRGVALEATATILPSERRGEVLVALARTYPVQFRLLRGYQIVRAVLRGRSTASTREGTVAIELTRK